MLFAVLLSNQLSSATAVHESGGKWTRHDLIGRGPRQEHSVVSLHNESVWLVGGVGFSETGTQVGTINRVEYFRLSDQTWHKAAPIPTPMNHVNAAAVDDKIYLLGGLSTGADWVAAASSAVYHPTNDSWTPIAPQPNTTTIRGSCAVGVLNGTIYLAGGMTYIHTTAPGTPQDAVRAVSSYDTLTNTWNVNYPPLPAPRQHVGSAVIGTRFYVIGGREFGIEERRNTTFILDLETPSAGWKRGADMPTARGGLSCAAVGVVVYCFGGEGNPLSAHRVFNQVEAYNTLTDKWISLPPMPVPRHGLGVSAVHGRIYVPGGGLFEGGGATGWLDSFAP